MGDNNNIELYRSRDGQIYLAFWDWMRGEDQHYKISADGLVYRREETASLRESFVLVEDFRAEMDGLLKKIEGNNEKEKTD